MAEVEICSRPGCNHPGTKQCSACKTKAYCGPICQTADWPLHKIGCQGHIRKVGMANLQKANAFNSDAVWGQALHYSELALVKLKQLKDLPIVEIDQALHCKFNSLNYMGEHEDALECAKECYSLYLTNHTHPPAIKAGFDLIESCIHNGEYEDAVLYASTTWETITLSRDSHIPEKDLPWFTATGAYFLAKATINLARSGGIPPEQIQASGQEAISLARKALEIQTQLYGLENVETAGDMDLLALILDHFNDADDDEVFRLHKQAKDINARLQGSLSPNVAGGERNLGASYFRRASKAKDANDLDRCVANLELALPHYREAARIYREINHVDKADKAARDAEKIEQLRLITIERAAAVAAATRG